MNGNSHDSDCSLFPSIFTLTPFFVRLLVTLSSNVVYTFKHPYIGGVERGERNISLDNLEKTTNGLHVEPKVLFEGDMPVQQANLD